MNFLRRKLGKMTICKYDVIQVDFFGNERCYEVEINGLKPNIDNLDDSLV